MVYSIVRKVLPGAICSHQTGEHEIDHSSDISIAQRFTNFYNNHVSIDGVSYHLETFDRDDHPDRKPTEEMTKHASKTQAN